MLHRDLYVDHNFKCFAKTALKFAQALGDIFLFCALIGDMCTASGLPMRLQKIAGCRMQHDISECNILCPNFRGCSFCCLALVRLCTPCSESRRSYLLNNCSG